MDSPVYIEESAVRIHTVRSGALTLCGYPATGNASTGTKVFPECPACRKARKSLA